MHFALLAGIDAHTSQKDGPVSDRLALPGGRGAPNLRRGPQYPVEMGPGGDPNPWGPQNFMTLVVARCGLRCLRRQKPRTDRGSPLLPHPSL